MPNQELNREQETVLLMAYKYFYRTVNIEEVGREISELGLLDMHHNDFEEFRHRLIRERKFLEDAIKLSVKKRLASIPQISDDLANNIADDVFRGLAEGNHLINR